MTPILYTFKEAAELLSVSQRTIRRLAADGELSTVRVAQTAVRVTADSVARYVSSHAEVPAPRKSVEDDK